MCPSTFKFQPEESLLLTLFRGQRRWGKGVLSTSKWPWFKPAAEPPTSNGVSRRQVSAPSVAEIRIPCDLPFLVFVFTTLPASPFLIVNTRFIVEQATVSEDANLPSVLAPTPVFKSATDSVPGTGLLIGRGRHDRFASSRPH